MKHTCYGMCPLDDDTYARRPSHFVWGELRNVLLNSTRLEPVSMSYQQWFDTVDAVGRRKKAAAAKKWRAAAKPNRLMIGLQREVFALS